MSSLSKLLLRVRNIPGANRVTQTHWCAALVSSNGVAEPTHGTLWARKTHASFPRAASMSLYHISKSTDDRTTRQLSQVSGECQGIMVQPLMHREELVVKNLKEKVCQDRNLRTLRHRADIIVQSGGLRRTTVVSQRLMGLLEPGRGLDCKGRRGNCVSAVHRSPRATNPKSIEQLR